MDKNKMFFGGVPTEPDVKKIRDAYPESELKPGNIIKYAEIESIIGTNYGSNRWASVTTSWRKNVEKETNIIIGARNGEEFYVCTEPEKVDLSSSKAKSAGRAARRSYIVAARTDVTKLDEHAKARLDHIMGVSSRILASAKIKSRVELPTLG